MIGGLSDPYPTTNIQQIPPFNVVSPYYGYQGGYSLADTLRPKQGYWVKVQADGLLILGGSFTVPQARERILYENAITFSDKVGHHESLNFQTRSAASGNEVIELPPPPPTGGFDVRFRGNRLLGQLELNRELPVLLESPSYPL